MKTEYTIRHRTIGDIGGFPSMTSATLEALGFDWPLDEWTIALVEAPPSRSFAPFADLPQTARRDRALERWARS